MKDRDIPEEVYEEDEINLLDLLIVIFKRKRLILTITFAIVVITTIVSLILPNIYIAKATILPPQKSNPIMTSQILNQLGGAANIAGNLFGITSTSDLYVAMLRSRTVYDRIIDKFDLMTLYQVSTRDDAREALNGKVNFNTDRKSGIITISVEDRDPERAAQMANAFVEELKNLTKNLALTEAAQRRMFFEEQLKEAKTALARAEKEMTRFQTETGALKIDEQAKALIEAIANIKARIAEKEVELRVMRTYAATSNPDLQKVEESLKALKEELKKLEASQKEGKYDPLMPVKVMPEVGAEYLRKLRELKFAETLYELLLKQYEIAKMDEARDAVIIQVIDKAVPPERKAKPRRTLMVVIALIAGGCISLLIAFIVEFIESSGKVPTNQKRIEELKYYIGIKKK